MEQVLRLTIDLALTVILLTCGVPVDDMSKDLNAEPIRMACTVTNGEDTYLFAGKVFKIVDGEADGMWQ